MYAVYTEKFKGCNIKIFVDAESLNPRTDYDNLGKMVCFHKRYTLGDKNNIRHNKYNGWDEIKKAIIEYDDAVIVLPLFLYDHTVTAIATTPFGCRWDSGQIGFIYVTRKDIMKEYGGLTKTNIETARQVLESEVAVYNDYLTGEVYGYVIESENEEVIKSCWGFYGRYDSEYGALTEARNTVKLLTTNGKTDINGQLLLTFARS